MYILFHDFAPFSHFGKLKPQKVQSPTGRLFLQPEKPKGSAPCSPPESDYARSMHNAEELRLQQLQDVPHSHPPFLLDRKLE
jgi:hypothetical protein